MKEAEIDLRKKSLDFTLEWSKQIITLSTGIVVLSATFLSDMPSIKIGSVNLLRISWGLFIVSILFGIVVIGGLIAQLNQGKPEKINAFANPIRISSLIQIISFIGGLILFAIFAILNL